MSSAITRLIPEGREQSQRIAIVESALACIAERGLKKTTVEEIAVTAGMSRATLYRVFPGGREAVLQGVVETELARFFSNLAVAMGTASSLEGVLVAGIHDAARQLTSHQALLSVVNQEPWLVMHHVAFGEMDHALDLASSFTEPFFARWLDPQEARRAAEFAVRILVSYLLDPDPEFSLTDEHSVRGFVRAFVLAGVESLQFQNLNK